MKFIPYAKHITKSNPNDWGKLEHNGKVLCDDIQRKNACVITERISNLEQERDKLWKLYTEGN